MNEFTERQIELLATVIEGCTDETRQHHTREKLQFLNQLTTSHLMGEVFNDRCRFLELLIHGLVLQQESVVDAIECYTQEGDSAAFKQKLEAIAHQFGIV
ncbi:hypothetical protein NIES2135_61480 (plasmid) [Leptolyngbya boryana NIES-2135]|jgi:hypothetical protein|uniref:Uncharacterized protein n=1 Tax=Leptolyngbya boryana NIES-2135 TaxID=1973484 RepID=A0A1Z4JR82_LEPBY|nr:MULTISPECIES: hypothetical protein [Leptolyngbya]BAY59271.1 hypothetical protein NIES2135_61480 [Leptolyngbya boryana NIES-2135]MBD2372859.1 hypothetical protein [Leptolyngbya sp. FACHB-238]MBD2397388.1 hypothetical protein [Leptolyngbya sp. FACHB-239]MBD2403807.1 hypothetical protein [Leptolyngbya sp. FACHB-402]ULP33463.1 hypothetical protein MCP04_30505 [Leptolyngbya boryana IU 594]